MKWVPGTLSKCTIRSHGSRWRRAPSWACPLRSCGWYRCIRCGTAKRRHRSSKGPVGTCPASVDGQELVGPEPDKLRVESALVPRLTGVVGRNGCGDVVAVYDAHLVHRDAFTLVMALRAYRDDKRESTTMR